LRGRHDFVYLRENDKAVAFATDLFMKVCDAHGIKHPLGLVTVATNSKSRKYGKKASSKVGRAMHEMKRAN
jgi:hypothetical protein